MCILNATLTLKRSGLVGQVRDIQPTVNAGKDLIFVARMHYYRKTFRRPSPIGLAPRWMFNIAVHHRRSGMKAGPERYVDQQAFAANTLVSGKLMPYQCPAFMHHIWPFEPPGFASIRWQKASGSMQHEYQCNPLSCHRHSLQGIQQTLRCLLFHPVRYR